MRTLDRRSGAALLIALSTLVFFAYTMTAHAQTAAQNQLRATITSEIMADPRSQTMTQAQIYALVNSLVLQAQKQGITNAQLIYRPEAPAAPVSTLTPCTDISCSVSRAFGLDGTLPLIPIALLMVAALFILIYGIMREMGHPHARA